MTQVQPRFEAAEYCRKARRLRRVHRHDLGRMHREIQDLSTSPETRETLRSRTSGPAAAFARLVERSLGGVILRYSLREQLLQEAQRMGIGRFEANLIIATVQHRHQGRLVESIGEPGKRRWMGPLLVVLALEALTALAALKLFI